MTSTSVRTTRRASIGSGVGTTTVSVAGGAGRDTSEGPGAIVLAGSVVGGGPVVGAGSDRSDPPPPTATIAAIALTTASATYHGARELGSSPTVSHTGSSSRSISSTSVVVAAVVVS
jgi:hypothetical protein